MVAISCFYLVRITSIQLQNLFTSSQNELNISGLTLKFTTTNITETVAGKMITLPTPFKNKHMITLVSIEGTAGYPQLHTYRYTNTSYSLSVQSVSSGTLTVYGCSIGY